ncbi:hypothetical protein [Mycobacterium leprae TN] [Mycobacterium shimoidei]|uniref:CobQ/CobB/MinD/ParA nucleotide binding domain-containing protein n=1 Tax=Mycobacterium shimoidei TaxID=29313 RepID=A0A375Z4D8_MYCSH|nr:hypothetical protein [Mycobacterium leprae TN] [Mycobacterium shimoidei]
MPPPPGVTEPVPIVTEPVPIVTEPAPVTEPEHPNPQDAEVSARPRWRDLFARVPRPSRGPSKQRAYELGLRQRVSAPVDSTFTIAVVNLKGGVGKTAVVEALGSTFADARDDRVIAVDVDAGDLIDRHGQRNSLRIAELLSQRSVVRYLDLRAQAHRNSSGLEVLWHADSDRPLEGDDVVQAISLLENRYSVVLVDCGKELKSSAAEAVLTKSHALAVVTDTSLNAIRQTRITLDWLADNGYGDLLRSTILVINHTEQQKPNALADKELRQLVRHFAAKRVVALPFDPHLREGKEIVLARLSRQSRHRYLEMAAVLADMFPRSDGANSTG